MDRNKTDSQDKAEGAYHEGTGVKAPSALPQL